VPYLRLNPPKSPNILIFSRPYAYIYIIIWFYIDDIISWSILPLFKKNNIGDRQSSRLFIMINICVFAFIIAPGGNESICVRKPAGWWFGSFFIFHHIWDNPSH